MTTLKDTTVPRDCGHRTWQDGMRGIEKIYDPWTLRYKSVKLCQRCKTKLEHERNVIKFMNELLQQEQASREEEGLLAHSAIVRRRNGIRPVTVARPSILTHLFPNTLRRGASTRRVRKQTPR